MPDVLRDTLVSADYLAAKVTQGWLVEAEEDANRIIDEFCKYYSRRGEQEVAGAFKFLEQELMERSLESSRTAPSRSKFYYQVYLLVRNRRQVGG